MQKRITQNRKIYKIKHTIKIPKIKTNKNLDFT